MLIWNFNGQGPNPPPGQIFTAALGTAVAFSAGLAVGYTGLALANPATVAGQTPVKLTPLRVTFAPTALAGGTAAFGLVKLTGQGTASNGGLSAFSGVVMSPGFQGTCATNGTRAGLGTSVVQIGGTFSVINSTAAGTGANTLYWAEMLGAMAAGTGGPNGPVDLQGFTTVMPGETIAIAPNLAVTGLASISWLETPLNSGA